jgi:hypothetical protein
MAIWLCGSKYLLELIMAENTLTQDIWNIATSLSQDAQNAAREKCKEKSFDENKGIVSLTESFSNMSQVRDLLIDAVDKQKINQLPLTIQNSIKVRLESTSKLLTNLVEGTDSVEALVKSIEELYSLIWQSGLQNLSDEFLGYQTKLNQLKVLEVKSNELVSTLEVGKKITERLPGIEKQITDVLKNGTDATGKVEADLVATNKLVAEIITAHKDASDSLTKINENVSVSGEVLTEINRINSEVAAIGPKIEEFYQKVKDYEKQIEDNKKEVSEIIVNNNKSTSDLINELKVLKNQIKDQIQEATGFKLFGSFQERKRSIVLSKLLWGAGVFLTLALVAWLTYVLSELTQNPKYLIGTGFYIKLSIYLPLFFSIIFCTKNYSHERTLEEEYAFKANISVSLIPFQELVDKIGTDKTKASEFLISAINNVFSSPTDKVFHKSSEKNPLDKSFQKMMLALKEVSAIAKNLKS